MSLPSPVEQAIAKRAPEIDSWAQKRYGLSGVQLLRGLVKVESGGRHNAVSPVGARGETQFMPGTRDAVRKKYGVDPWKNADQAVEAAILHLKGKVTGNPGLRGYNPGDPRYPGQVLAAARASGAGGQKGRGSASVSSTRTVPGKTSTDVDGALIDAVMGHRSKSLAKDLAYRLGTGNYTTTSEPTTVTTPARPGASAAPATGGKASVAPTANKPGHNIHSWVLDFANSIAGRVGGLEIGTGTNHNRFVAGTNRVSDHADGSAVDIPAPVDSARGDRIAAAALVEAGVDAKKARQMAQQGGLWNLTKGGYRIQVIWRTNEGGNHHNHVHVGVRKL